MLAARGVAAGAGGATGAIVSEACRDLRLPAPEMPELYRYLGYPRHAAPPARIADRLPPLVERALVSLSPAGAYAVHPVASIAPRSIVVDGATIRGDVGRFLGASGRIAVFAVTAGRPITELAQDAAESGDVLAAWAFDALGSWAAEAAADTLMERIAVHLAPGEAMTLRYSPGYCGMAMTQQRVLFGLVDAAAAGVELLPSLLMQPMKSVSGIVGLAPAGSVAAYRSPCDRCRRVGCHMRREGPG